MENCLYLCATPKQQVCGGCGELITSNVATAVSEEGEAIAYLCRRCVRDRKAALALLTLRQRMAEQLLEILQGISPTQWEFVARSL